jgi:hypothetical protein
MLHAEHSGQLFLAGILTIHVQRTARVLNHYKNSSLVYVEYMASF